MSTVRFRVDSVGHYVPPKVQTAAEVATLIGRSENWVLSRTGVVERRVSDEPMQMLAARAARAAIGDGPPPDLIINASLTPVQLIPDSSVFIQRELGYNGIPSFSIHATCLSFLVGLHTAGTFVHAGRYKRILVVSAEQGSVCRDFEQPESAALIGDGAAAAIVVPTPADGASELLAWGMTTWPEGADLAELRGCGIRRHPNNPETRPSDNLFHMHGPRIYKLTVRRLVALYESLLEEANLAPSDLALVVPHQASGPGLSAIARFGGLDPERVVNVVHEYGNCIAASIPLALSRAHAEGRLNRGDIILVLGMGAGLSVAGALLRW
jgi:3-oxoacyl-[acyl-carrier-protein] synthase-3